MSAIASERLTFKFQESFDEEKLSDGRLTNATAVQHSADGNSSRTSRSPCHRLPPRTPPSSLPSWGPEHGTMRVMLQKNPHEITLRFKLYPSMQSPIVIKS